MHMLNKIAFYLAVLFLSMVLLPSHMGMQVDASIHPHSAAANPDNQLYKFILPITTHDFQSGSEMISIQVKNNFNQSNNKWLNALLFFGVLLYCCYMVIWFFRNDRPVPTALAYSSEISLCIGGHAPPECI